jgi:hypothetical protein
MLLQHHGGPVFICRFYSLLGYLLDKYFTAKEAKNEYNALGNVGEGGV